MNYISAIGLDVGKKRIGVAGCDGTGLIATGLTTILRTSFRQDVYQLKQLIHQRRATILVVGLPYSLNGEIGIQAQLIQQFAQRISIALQLPIDYMDERFTSMEAEQLLRDEKKSPSRDKGAIDRKAAAIILQQWLDERRARLN
ncbi:MAG: Holliday junction resolvase RuvX [Synechococcales bacterium]|jgi:putative Holliday junction resolvase|nr:Holliday junction resolvase RuvX [Synechococcales bacterium]